MSRFVDWLEDYYYYIVMIVVIAVFAFGGISMCNTKSETTTATVLNQSHKIEHRAEFFDKYKEHFPQFMDASDFSVWLDNTDKESIVLLHSLVEAYGNEYDGDEGFGNMDDYLEIAF